MYAGGPPASPRPGAAASILLAAAAISASLWWLGPPVAGLAVAMGVAVPVHRATLGRRAPSRAWVRLYFGALAWQLVHFGEELLTGFQQAWPGLFGLPPWSTSSFVAFNLVWYALFALAPAARRSLGWCASFFLVAMFANGVGHLALAIWRGSLFPGVVTAPGSLVWGVLLVRRWVRDGASLESA